ncbi:uncharacterized protein LOC115876780 [Sitophilus oryzae]|uniref:Uncharacterized protein LOC115876780 n=1 Tax=Sitophilus oryzae TaxID=7048 RepID=A0A6J2XBE4_SITOR|nr:uncharacterized protein LOC115876780 [Sitophilus oryzae]
MAVIVDPAEAENVEEDNLITENGNRVDVRRVEFNHNPEVRYFYDNEPTVEINTIPPLPARIAVYRRIRRIFRRKHHGKTIPQWTKQILLYIFFFTCILALKYALYIAVYHAVIGNQKLPENATESNIHTNNESNIKLKAIQ